MLTLKQQEVSRKKMIIYFVVMALMLLGAFLMYYNQFIKKQTVGQATQNLAEIRDLPVQGGSSAAIPSNNAADNSGKPQNIEISQSKDEDFIDFEDIIKDQKFKDLNEIYKEEKFMVEYGKDNPFE